MSADRVDEYIANSKFVAGRIKKYYQKDSIVINPPVNTKKFIIGDKTEDYFLVAGRLMTYKRFDIVIEAFNKLGWPLKIIGRGPDFKRLRKMSRPNIEFTGRLSDDELISVFSKTKAFIFPQEEDFGIIAIEAMASGKPIVAFQGGDIIEHVREGVEGIFFKEQTAGSLIEALKKFDSSKFNSQDIREKALPFDREIFKVRIKDYVERSRIRHRNGLDLEF